MAQDVSSRTRGPLFWGATLLIIIALVSGCAGEAAHPAGLDRPRKLTDTQKNRAIEIALNTPEAKAQLSKNASYKTNIDWIALIWKDSGYSEMWGIDYEWETDLNLASPISKGAVFYSRVSINFGEPPTWQVVAAINPLTGKVALVEEYPYRTGPTPPR
ncbi:MAG: hypothetical protein HYX84_06645 [Chloroflexi bacterium]|nr:hypothetical protein [Chloroflexota bacterium]